MPVPDRHCTLLFSDIRGFTTYSRSRDPAKVVETLNRILSLQAGIIRKAGGDVVECDVGSEDIRNYTVIGDVVNTAARLESQARSGEILVSEAVAGHEGSRERCTFEEKGELKLKGKEITIRTFSVKGRRRT